MVWAIEHENVALALGSDRVRGDLLWDAPEPSMTYGPNIPTEER